VQESIRSAEVEEAFQGFKELIKLRRSISFTHRAVAEKSQRLRKPFGGFER
jgi:hypothetical protein